MSPGSLAESKGNSASLKTWEDGESIPEMSGTPSEQNSKEAESNECLQTWEDFK